MNVRVVEVLRTERVSDELVRIVFGGDLADFAVGAFTDHYVKIQFPPQGADYAAPYDVADIKARLPKEAWPRTRTYTVRHFDAEQLELTVDFVVHGDRGVAGPWAMAAQPGDRLQLAGPGGAYVPRADADWHLLIGDAAALPAIAASLPHLPDGATAHVIVGAGEVPLEAPANVHIDWVDDLPAAVAAAEFPPGTPHVFLHGEASETREIRRQLLADRGYASAGQSISGYWKRERTEEGWRDDKAEWKRLTEEDDRAASVS